jgi:Rrf2 family iron-sulfur cluster assembly transcriptional regulator
MIVPIKVHYATLALFALADRSPKDDPLALRSISEQYDIPLPFLTQIVQQLRAAGLVSSTRGPAGGFRLARSALGIRLLDVAEAVGFQPDLQGERLGSSPAQQLLASQWLQIERDVFRLLEETTLHDLLSQRTPVATMFYI